ncbi:Protein CBR-ACR-3 [Caenorhabditis briggsae]|uniref:Protein CBR-ACR-3 n=1 Tax=Caenorhabditis briggsae TaxID=6238 RepID=A8XC65_CAEBR|nr:Protein CBR-ACR-3 [Caenorhabditis briggsae]CAP30163.2 Protein CBR-ACR-3 [Caenorhabditis briggsae]
MCWWFRFSITIILVPVILTYPNSAEERLLSYIFDGYNSLIRPVLNASSPPIEVFFSLAFVLLINVDEKNQIMQTNVWPTMKWNDYQMQWDPREFDGIKTIRVPPDKVWLPDIVLFNNADGNYLVSFYSNVVVEHTGDMLWVPPAVYKSSCLIDVEFFPFDEQVCSLTFGSWTFRKDELQLSYLSGKRHVELNDYLPSGVWDLMDAPGLLIDERSKISYQIKIRRKALFYTVILIMPTVLMAFLSMMVFYLPAESSEKITLAISILLALVVFLLVVSKILPPTSSTIPLMAKYLLMTFIMNMITIMCLPVLFVMRRPESTEKELAKMKREKRERRSMKSALKTFFKRAEAKQIDDQSKQALINKDRTGSSEEKLSSDAKKAIEAIEYITTHLTHDNAFKRQREEWKFVSVVIDRLLLYLFFGVTTGGTMGILLSAPNVFEHVNQTAVIERLKQQAAEEMLNS